MAAVSHIHTYDKQVQGRHRFLCVGCGVQQGVQHGTHGMSNYREGVVWRRQFEEHSWGRACVRFRAHGDEWSHLDFGSSSLTVCPGANGCWDKVSASWSKGTHADRKWVALRMSTVASGEALKNSSSSREVHRAFLQWGMRVGSCAVRGLLCRSQDRGCRFAVCCATTLHAGPSHVDASAP